MTQPEKKVLFVCTGNAGRSQMAEIFFARMAGDAATACSAGVAPWPHLHPVAVKLLSERGIDTTGRHPKHVRQFTEDSIACVVTIGDRARNELPRFAGNPTLIHWDISDPADADGTGREKEAFAKSLALIEERLPSLCEIVKNAAFSPQLHLEPGISTSIVRPAHFDAPAHLPAFAAAGIKCIELNCFIGSDDFPWDRAGKVKELRDVADSTGVRVYSVHAEGGFGACRGTRSERMALDICRAFADLAAELGASLVVVHGDLPPDADPAAARLQLRQSLQALADHVRDMPVAFGWENLPWKNYPIAHLPVEEHLAWIRELGQNAFGFVLDTGHSNIDGNTEAYLSGSNEILRGLHVNDNNAQADQHVVPGAGNQNWDGFVTRLLNNGYRGPLMLETVGTGGNPPRPLEVALAEARSSIQFLKDTSRL